MTLNTVRATVSFNILLTKRFKTFCAYQDLTMENPISIFGEAPIMYHYGMKPLTKWQQTIQDVLREQREAGKPISLPAASKIASDRYLIACIEEDNAKHPDARRSARLQKKAAIKAPPIKPSAPPAEPSAPPAEPLAWAVPYPDDDCESIDSLDSLDSIDTPLTDEELDAAFYELEKNADY